MVKYWLPALIWMVLIFSGSSDPQSGHKSSRIIEPFIRWLKPNISQESVHRIVFIARKGAHLMEYALLAALLWWARRASSGAKGFGWDNRHAAFALIVAGLYAVTDEIHQAFVPNRAASVGDVVLDIIGAALGLVVICLMIRLRGR